MTFKSNSLQDDSNFRFCPAFGLDIHNNILFTQSLFESLSLPLPLSSFSPLVSLRLRLSRSSSLSLPLLLSSLLSRFPRTLSALEDLDRLLESLLRLLSFDLESSDLARLRESRLLLFPAFFVLELSDSEPEFEPESEPESDDDDELEEEEEEDEED